MTQVGLAPWHDIKRRTIRAPVNPLDRATVVSVYPRLIDETKCTIQPGRFIIEPGTYDKPSVLVVTPSSWWRDIDDEQPLLEIPVSSIQVADSVVRDYCIGLLECEINTQMPGLFYIAGEKTPQQIKNEFKAQIDKATEMQKKWYAALVRLGDILWARSMGNPLSVSEEMKFAAHELGFEKDWLKDFTAMEMVKCIACGNLNNKSIVVCPNCKVVLDKEKFKTLGLSFAQ